MTLRRFSVLRDTRGATVIEFAFGFPILIMLVWMIYQFGLVYRANSGIQHALGQGARLATLYPIPTLGAIEDEMEEAVYGVGPGDFTFEVDDENIDKGYLDLTVGYEQDTNLLLASGPRVVISKTKRVWVAAEAAAGSGGSSGPSPDDPDDPSDPEPEPEPEPDPETDEPTQTCWNGAVISASATCPPETKTCENGTVIPVQDTCPVPPTTPPQDDKDKGPPPGKPVCDKSKRNPNC